MNSRITALIAGVAGLALAMSACSDSGSRTYTLPWVALLDGQEEVEHVEIKLEMGLG